MKTKQEDPLKGIPDEVKKACIFVFDALLPQNKKVIASSKMRGLGADYTFRAISISTMMASIAYLHKTGKIKFTKEGTNG